MPAAAHSGCRSRSRRGSREELGAGGQVGDDEPVAMQLEAWSVRRAALCKNASDQLGYVGGHGEATMPETRPSHSHSCMPIDSSTTTHTCMHACVRVYTG